MVRFGMVIDTTKCIGCYNCFLACKDEHCGNAYPPYSLAQPMTGHYWMRLIEKERGQYPKVKAHYLPVPCMHCSDAACVKAGADGAIYRRPDGIVIIDPEKAMGQEQLVTSCPYRVIYWNETKRVPQKCTFCAHLLDAGWREPRCVEACPTGALVFGDLDNPDSEVARLASFGKAEALHPGYDMKEKVSYIGIPKRFIAGTVVLGDTDQCADDVNVTLWGDGIKKTITTNNFGDFEFEGLEAEKTYQLTFTRAGYASKHISARTGNDIYFGEVILARDNHAIARRKS